MDITSITSATATNFLDPTVANRPVGKQALDQTDFLKLLTVQLQSQDPMKPMEDTQFISQMASFSALENSKDLSASFKTFTATSYLGKMVDIKDTTGTHSGEVTEITIANNKPLLMVGGKTYDPANVIRVTAKPLVATSPQP